MNPELAIYQRQVTSVLESKIKEQRIIRFFPNTDLRCGHDGLAKIAKEQKVSVTKLEKGEYVLFVNKSLTAAKLFVPGNIIAYLRMPGNQKIDPRTIALIPKFFNGSKISYDDALSEVLKKEFKLDV